jgi:hypothetical protein
MMKKILILFLISISVNVYSQENLNKTTSESITLQEFVKKTKAQNESIKNAESVNVMVNDLLIENLNEYRINPKNISRLEILVLDPKGVNREGTKPSIIITTKVK